jgi:tRNA(Arg) A34 adenosine deaminase TadA
MESHMKKACELAEQSIQKGGGPFGCVIIDKTTGEIKGEGHNQVAILHDPTKHAEMVAISNACNRAKTFDLSNCILYTSCEPCPMCLAAIYWSHIDTVYYGNTKQDAAHIGFDDQFIYDEFAKPAEQRKINMEQVGKEDASIAFTTWLQKTDKVHY